MKGNEQQESRAKYEEALERLRESGVVVEDVTDEATLKYSLAESALRVPLLLKRKDQRAE